MKRSFLIALLLFSIGLRVWYRRTVSATPISETLVAQLSDPETVVVRVKTIDGYSLVVLLYQGQEYPLSEPGLNSRQPHRAGEYVVYATDTSTGTHIFRTHVPTNARVQISTVGINLAPVVDTSGRVAWEHWEDETWNIYYYDGDKNARLTTGTVAREAEFVGESLTYRQKRGTGWVRERYDLKTRVKSDVAVTPIPSATTPPTAIREEISISESEPTATESAKEL